MREFQTHIAELYLEKDRKRGVEPTFLWLMEEVGELAEAVRRREDRANLEEEMADPPASPAATGASRLAGSPQTRRQQLEDEFADVAAWLASLANLLDVDLAVAAAKKYPATCRRCGHKPCACPEPAARTL